MVSIQLQPAAVILKLLFQTAFMLEIFRRRLKLSESLKFSVGRILESDITLIVFNRKVRIAATPIMRINTLFDITVKRRKPPIGNLSYIAMFDRIEMQIIKMAGKIGLIADSMFPKAFLPKPEIAAD